ncbi:MAG: ribosome maturation factor RimP [Bacteriovoracia bacterium]
MSETKPNSKEALELLEQQAQSTIEPMGYEVVSLEMNNSPAGRTLTLFIDFLNPSNDNQLDSVDSENKKFIGLDDCIAVNKVVDGLFEATPLLAGPYHLEVSSPGLERPLRKPKDFERYCGRKIKVHLFRPLETDASSDEFKVRQKNYTGQLVSYTDEKISLNIDQGGVSGAIEIPLKLITKAHLVAVLNADGSGKKNKFKGAKQT